MASLFAIIAILIMMIMMITIMIIMITRVFGDGGSVVGGGGDSGTVITIVYTIDVIIKTGAANHQ